MSTSVKPPIARPTTNRLETLRLQFMAEELKRQIGDRIRTGRLAAGLKTQGALADRLGPTVNNQVISNYETGSVRPSDKRLREIGDVLGKGLDYFYGNDPHQTADLGDAFDGDRLDRLEAKLDAIMGLLRRPGAVTLPGVLGAAVRDERAEPQHPEARPQEEHPGEQDASEGTEG